jgi:hypothetical protein
MVEEGVNPVPPTATRVPTAPLDGVSEMEAGVTVRLADACLELASVAVTM